MRDKMNRERCLMVYEVVRNTPEEEALSVQQIADIIKARLNLHQDTFERRAIYRDLRSMQEIGLPVKLRKAKRNMILAWGK